MARHVAGWLRRWPPEFRQPLFLALAGLYFFSLYNRHYGHWPLSAFLNSYLADLLALPLMLTVALSFMRHVYFQRPTFVLPASWIISSGLFTAIWFEGVLPRFWSAATADPFDVVAYAVGSFVFWRWLNRPGGVMR